jgi:hypothetical protein
MSSSHEVLKELTRVSGIKRSVLGANATVLKSHDMWARPPCGRSANLTQVDAFHMTNLLLSLAAPTSLAGPDAVLDIRQLRFTAINKGDTPYFDRADDFGDLIESLISSRAWTIARGADAGETEKVIPHQINISASPATAELVWFGPNGSIERREVYGGRVNGLSMIRRLSIPSAIIELAATFCVHQFRPTPADLEPPEVRAAREEAEFNAFAAKHNAEVRAARAAELKAASERKMSDRKRAAQARSSNARP